MGIVQRNQAQIVQMRFVYQLPVRVIPKESIQNGRQF
jgi:hypothetical protein